MVKAHHSQPHSVYKQSALCYTNLRQTKLRIDKTLPKQKAEHSEKSFWSGDKETYISTRSRLKACITETKRRYLQRLEKNHNHNTNKMCAGGKNYTGYKSRRYPIIFISFYAMALLAPCCFNNLEM